jgi:hypothetical protein
MTSHVGGVVRLQSEMRRTLLILLMFLVPFQWSWAAAASVCAPSSEAQASYSGQHEHRHAAESESAKADGSAVGCHSDCGACHGAGTGFVATADDVPFPWHAPVRFSPYQSAVPDRSLDSPFRPPSMLVA